eukprot:2252175-Prorocentrum_lima.AAC.1
MDISADISDVLRKHNILTVAVMTGKVSSTRICFGSEPVWTKAPPTDRPPCTYVPVKAAPAQPPLHSKVEQ